MFKSKAFLGSLLFMMIAIIGGVGFAIVKSSGKQPTFMESGYVLVSPGSTYSDEINKQIYFEKGTKYQFKYPNKVVFQDQKNKNMIIEADSFVHYNDGSVSSFLDGVMIDLRDLDNSIINYYGLRKDTVLESAGSEFVLDNQGNTLNFKDVMWKISENKYLLVSEKISITFSNNEVRDFQDYVELSYYDTGIIRIVTLEGTWQTVSSNCKAVLNNGIMINLSNKTVVKDNKEVKLSLEQMVIGADDNIDIIPSEVKKKAAKAPEFDIKTIDGADGQAGMNGEAGENGDEGKEGKAGEKGKIGEIGEEGEAGADGTNGTDGIPGDPGSPGTTGTTGVSGVNGVNGASGANGASGVNGAIGTEGRNGDEVAAEEGIPGYQENIVVLPIFDFTSFEAKTNMVKAEITVTDKGNLLDVSVPFVIQITNNATGQQVHRTQIDSSNQVFNFEYNGLMPNTDYRLMIIADYIVDGNNYTKVFVNKLFHTETLGIAVQKHYATDNSLAFKVMTKGYSQISSADLQITDVNGTAIRTNAIDMISAGLNDGTIIVFDGLNPNTLYKIKIVNIELSYDTNVVSPPEVREETYWTLKRIPTLGKPVVIVNKRNSSFDMKLEKVVDLDGAITTYRYEIYEVWQDLSQQLAKTLYNSANDLLPCYVDGIEIKKNYSYKLRIVAMCYDNEKQVEYTSAYSELFSMTGTNFPTVQFIKDEDHTHHDKITGSFLINTNGSILKVDVQNPLIIEYQNSKGNVDNYQLTSLSEYVMSGSNGTRYTIPFTEGNLLARDNYILSIYGTIDLNDGAGFSKRSLIGSVIVATDTPAGFTANLSQDSTPTTPLAFRLNLSNDEAFYEASTMEFVEIKLYNGGEDAVANTAPVATYTIQGQNSDQYNSTLVDMLYGNNSILITEANFNISANAITSTKFTVEISSVRDYTRYGNEFEVTNHVATFTKQATLPDLGSINKDDGLIVIPITIANINQYVSDPVLLANYQGFSAGTVFGYEVSAAYFDNSANLTNKFIYYVYEEANYQTKPSATEFYAVQNWITSKTVDVGLSQTVPKAVFLFGHDEAVNMSRGSRYVFTYRAELKNSNEQGEPLYFPEFLDPTVVIRSRTHLAPYQTPVFSFYPWTSDTNSVTWRYRISSPDSEAIAGNFNLTLNGLTANDNIDIASRTPVLNLNDQSVKIINLTRGHRYLLSIATRLYKPIYGAATTNNLVCQQFESVYSLNSHADTSMSYRIEDRATENRYRIILFNPNTQTDHLSRVTAIKVGVYKTKGGNLEKTIVLQLDPLTRGTEETTATTYLGYGELDEFVGNTFYLTITAVYDNGISGFSGIGGPNTYRAIQAMPVFQQGVTIGLGNYLRLNYSHNNIEMSTTGTAEGSYFSMNNLTGTTTMSIGYRSAIDTVFSSTLSINNIQNGARLINSSSTQPYITLKALGEVMIKDKDSGTNDVYKEISLTSITPIITLNRGAAYTIDTTTDSATVHWKIAGHAAKIEIGDIKDNKMYFDLFYINALGEPSLVMGHEPIEEIMNPNISEYHTIISNLQANTKYGIKLYYINSLGERVYPINSYQPDKLPFSNMYTFTTSNQVVITPITPTATYVASSYTNKYIRLNYELNITLGFHIQYSICKKVGEDYIEVMSSQQLRDASIISTPSLYQVRMSEERIMLRPGEFYWMENGEKVYFPFNSSEYYVCLTPVSKTNSNDVLGQSAYIQLKIPNLNTPFYQVRTSTDINYKDLINFHVSIIDVDRVMVNGKYKIKMIDGEGTDITPVDYRNKVFNISNPEIFSVTGIPANGIAKLQIYTVYDMNNTATTMNGNPLLDIETVPYENLDDMIGQTKRYLKASYTGSPLGDQNYDLGDIQIAQSSSDLARLYFVNSVNLKATLARIQYVVVNENGTSTSYNETISEHNLIQQGNSFYYQLSHRFPTGQGVYRVQCRFYDSSMNVIGDKALTLFMN